MGSHPVSELSIKRRYLYISLVPPLPAPRRGAAPGAYAYVYSLGEVTESAR